MFPSRIGAGRPAGPPRVCQRCEQAGHAIYECKNPRPYKARPTRAQVLANPRLESRRPREVAPPELQQEGAADSVLEARRREREQRYMREGREWREARRPAPSPGSESEEETRGRSRRRSASPVRWSDRSPSSSASRSRHRSVSCSTCGSYSPRSSPRSPSASPRSPSASPR